MKNTLLYGVLSLFLCCNPLSAAPKKGGVSAVQEGPIEKFFQQLVAFEKINPGELWKDVDVAAMLESSDQIFIEKNKNEVAQLLSRSTPGSLKDFLLHVAVFRSGISDLIELLGRDPLVPQKMLGKSEAAYPASLYAVKLLLTTEPLVVGYSIDRIKSIVKFMEEVRFIVSRPEDFLRILVEAIYAIPEDAYRDDPKLVSTRLEGLVELAQFIVDSFAQSYAKLARAFAGDTLVNLRGKLGYVKNQALEKIQKHLESVEALEKAKKKVQSKKLEVA